MTSCPEAMGRDSWVFWKKLLVEIRGWTKRVDFWTWGRPVQLWTTGCPHVGGSDGTVGVVKIVSLSSCWKPKSHEGNKSFVPEPRESSVFRDSYSCDRLTHPYTCILYISHNHILWMCYICVPTIQIDLFEIMKRLPVQKDRQIAFLHHKEFELIIDVMISAWNNPKMLTCF